MNSLYNNIPIYVQKLQIILVSNSFFVFAIWDDMHQKSLHRFWRHGRTDQWNLGGISGDMAPNKTRFQSFTVIVQIFFWTNYYSSEVFFELSYSKICDHSPSNCHLFQVMAAQWSHWSPEFVVGLRPIEKDDEDNMVIFHFANTKQPLRWGATFWDIFPLGDLLDFFHPFFSTFDPWDDFPKYHWNRHHRVTDTFKPSQVAWGRVLHFCWTSCWNLWWCLG